MIENTPVPHFDASSAECLVLTYKEGLLSAVAHDLRIRVTRFDVEASLSPPSVRARFDAARHRALHEIGRAHV